MNLHLKEYEFKLFDIAVTVGRTIKAFSSREVDFATIHSNDDIMEAVVQNKGDLDNLGFKCNVQQLVLSRAKRVLGIGCDGIVSSGLEVRALRQILDRRLLVVTLGVRPVDNRSVNNDQKRVTSIEQAFKNGTDYIVIGHPN